MAIEAHRYEKAFLGLSAGMLVLFLGALFYAAYGLGIELPTRAGEIDPAQVRSTPPFDDPGVHRSGAGRYDVVIVAQAWVFQPKEITVPAGAEVRIRTTSTDVIHGVHIEGTRVNAMIIPGQITEVTYTFEEPGEHLFICHEFCGANHHEMFGRITVVPAADSGGARRPGGPGGREAAR